MTDLPLSISVVRLDKQLDLPTYAHEGDAGLDLMAREEITIAPAGGRILMPTGISIAIPRGYAGFVLPRSGLALKNGVTVLNSPGLIDSAYRGEIKVVLVNTDPRNPYRINRGDRIAQLGFNPFHRCSGMKSTNSTTMTVAAASDIPVVNFGWSLI